MTTDLIAGKSVWLQRGPVDAAIRASIAIPGVIAPHVLDGRLLLTAAYLDPLPMAPIAAVNADLTAAVSLSGSEAGGRDEPTETDPRRTTEWLNRLFAHLRYSTPTRPVPCSTHRRHGPCSAASAPARTRIRRHQLANYPPDILIEVPRAACRSLELLRAAEVIDAGHELAARVLDLLDKPQTPILES